MSWNLSILSPLVAGVMTLTLAGCHNCKGVPGHQVKNGMRAPSVVVSNQYGQQVNFSELASAPWTAVFFFPKANTPG